MIRTQGQFEHMLCHEHWWNATSAVRCMTSLKNGHCRCEHSKKCHGERRLSVMDCYELHGGCGI